ncbi:RNA recognition motif domain containing protein [Acanthamoeba castellanii str. Neff]|uniref:RNA recognition motif domain containing protein n=1 Tax=Acanthamoeba castellanii (strain ATCC 30010 / Neff) TaxID=1257118 RepID=L8GYB9_ACACF|nr:RNA recognition motif domain containing protein [Acanthamoeba castellanii str. Neff]ELR17076.1 RNA recognition motif domain containing protein [Acanthamoeba castellanii str. Neff]
MAEEAALHEKGGEGLLSTPVSDPGSDGLLPVPPQFSVSTVIVTNISPLATEQDLRDFFANCGNIVQINLLGDGLGISQYAFVRFETMAQANAALTLSTGAVAGMPVKIVMAASDIPVGGAAAAATAALPTPLALTPGVGAASGLGLLGAIPHSLALLSGSPANAQSYHEKQDEIARTIYVGNVNSTITSEQLMQFFAICGPITFCRLAGDESHPSRFAFIEFATKEAAQAAMMLNGTMLLDRAVKVNHSKNPIVKPPKTVDNAKDEQILDAVKRAAMRWCPTLVSSCRNESTFSIALEVESQIEPAWWKRPKPQQEQEQEPQQRSRQEPTQQAQQKPQRRQESTQER